MNNENDYIEIEIEDERYLISHEGVFMGDESRRDIRVLEPEEVSDFEMGVEQAGTRVGVDPSEYDSVEQMYRDAVVKSQEMNSGWEEELFNEDPLEENEDQEDQEDQDPLEQLDMYGK